MLKLLSHLHFQPARFYFNALQAIDRLEALGGTTSTLASGQFKRGIVGSSDIGFRELIEILRENRTFMGEVEEIVLGELRILGGTYQDNIPLTPQRFRILMVIQKGEKELLYQERFDPNRITRNLRIQAEEITRKRIGSYLVALIFLYMIAGIYLVATV